MSRAAVTAQLRRDFGLPDEEPTATEVGLEALAKTAARAKNAALIATLVPVARELAGAAGFEGVTVSHLREVAIDRGILTGAEQGRTLSFLGAVMKAAGLLNTGRRRRSHLRVTHGIAQTVWVSRPS